MQTAALLQEMKTWIDRALDFYLPAETEYPHRLHEAMRYSVFAGGKRIRPLLTLLTAGLFTPHWKRALPAACALELIHTYSLIHDDLPAMDDDDYRRGRLTSHKVYGEGMAILAGDALLTLAFEVLAEQNNTESEFYRAYVQDVAPHKKINIILEIARNAGIRGMVGGQAVDLQSEGKNVATETLEYIDTHKTGALITAAVRAGALLAGAGKKDMDKITIYGNLLGQAFQIVDDLLDVEGNAEKMGKATGKDAQKEKATLIALAGLATAKKSRDQLYRSAIKELGYFDEKKSSHLKELTHFIFYRDF